MDKLKIYYDNEINKELIKNKIISIIGFGSQGYGQSLNLKESGCNVILGLREGGTSWKKAQNYDLKIMSIKDAVQHADIVQVLIPDEVQAKVYKEEIEPYLKPGQYLMFSHGFNIHYKYITPPDFVNVLMVAPKAPGHTVRSEYQEGKGTPSLIAIYQDITGDTKDVALSYASAIGAGRAGIIETTFKEETETDLFGEQSVICGGVSHLITTAFETLTEAGYSPYMAYFEVCHELKLLVDLINQGGISDMHYSISNNAEYGDLTRGGKVINPTVKEAMRNILKDIQTGDYAKEFMNEMENGGEKFNKLREESKNHLIEKVGSEIRNSFTWNNKKIINKDIN